MRRASSRPGLPSNFDPNQAELIKPNAQFSWVFMMPAPLFNDGLELPAKRHLATAVFLNARICG